MNINGLTEENRIVLSKMMAFRYHEAQEVSQKIYNMPLSANLSDPRVAAHYVQNIPVAVQLYNDYWAILTDPWIENASFVAMSYRICSLFLMLKVVDHWI